MPTYTYHCRKCDKTFSVQMSMSDHGIKRVKCPSCKRTKVEPVITSFVAMTSKKS